MNQRFDLLAISLLIFAVIFTVWLTIVPSLEGIARWQTLISGTIAGLGIVFASWNVSRQMRLAARGREQDRIDRELPGLRAAAWLLARFAFPIGLGIVGEPNTKRILDEFDAVGLNQGKIADFLDRVVKELPLTPDRTRRQLGLQMLSLRRATLSYVMRKDIVASATKALDNRREADPPLVKQALNQR